MDGLPSFVRPLSPGGEVVEEPLRLTDEAKRELRQELEALARHRDMALITGQFYYVR